MFFLLESDVSWKSQVVESVALKLSWFDWVVMRIVHHFIDAVM